MQSKVNFKRDTRQLINVAWARNDSAGSLITGEALFLATLMRSTGPNDRSGISQVQKMMGDLNYEE